MFSYALQKPLRGWFFLFLVLSVIDLLCTAIILGFGLVNGNPFATFLLQHMGIPGTIAMKIAVLTAIIYAIGNLVRRSPQGIDLACNLFIVISGLMLLSTAINLAECALVY